MFEIGSEFWTSDTCNHCSDYPFWNDWRGDKKFYLSGRTALEAIIRDILRDYDIKTAYLPSYCCHTMIEPFLRHGLKVEFYPVDYKDGSLHISCNDNKHDVTLVLDYFGFHGYAPESLSDTVTIRDLTHSLLSANSHELKSDYTFASFRKWGAVAGAAIACKSEGKFHSSECQNETNDKYIDIRKRAYSLKASYINGKIENKPFLDLFCNAEELLEVDYAEYAADNESLNAAAELKRYAQSRRENANMLLVGLSGSKLIMPMFPVMHTGDVPLFVPVLVNEGLRDALKKHLIDNRVYCPMHWPLSELHTVSSEEKRIYEQELSLICDQRYGEEEMKRQLSLIREFEIKYV